VLHLLTNRREDLVAIRTQTINRLHRLLVDLVPAGAGRNLTAALLGQVAPAGRPASTRYQIATELVMDVRGLDRRIAAVEAQIKVAVLESRTSLWSRSGSARCWPRNRWGEIGDVRRFPTKHHVAAHTGTARWRPPAARSSATACHGLETASSTTPST
jgi:transposase